MSQLSLTNVLSAKYLEPAPSTVMECLILADIGEGEEELTFIYHPDDPFGLNPEVTAWFFDHPEFEPELYVEPPEEEPDPLAGLSQPLTKRQVNAALIATGTLDPDGFILSALSQLEDPVLAATARNDWLYAPYYKREHEFFNDPAILAATGLTPEGIDLLWLLAIELPE